jgi:hypothetical protein
LGFDVGFDFFKGNSASDNALSRRESAASSVAKELASIAVIPSSADSRIIPDRGQGEQGIIRRPDAGGSWPSLSVAICRAMLALIG